MEQSSRDHAYDRHLGAAGDERRGHDGHLAVAVIFDGTGGHDTGHAAAGADQHGDEALTGQAELAEYTVHYEGDTGHIADVFKYGQHEEQNQHLGNEAEYSAHTADDTVADQADQPVRGAYA